MSPLFIVVSIVLIDLLGFTIVMPLLPRFAEQFHFSQTQIGIILAAYPMAQLVAGPILGRLSDRFGRRPILAISQAGTAISFVLLAFSSQFPLMLFARLLDGASGGNILVAQAYIADVTAPEHRSRSLGMIGAAFGLGFVLGPLLGGLLLGLPLSPIWLVRMPFLVAAGFSCLAWILVLWRLPESLPPDVKARQSARVLSWRGVADILADQRVALLVAIGALTVLAFAALEGTFSLYLEHLLGWSPKAAAFGFAFLGLVSAVVQGGFIRRLVPRFGEPRLILAGLLALALGMAGLASAHGSGAVLGAALLVGVGHGLASPSIAGLMSRVSPTDEQGAIFGAYASAQTLARMTNYVLANTLLGKAGPAAPYWEGAGVAIIALALASWTTLRFMGFGLSGAEPRIRAHAQADEGGEFTSLNP
jgi:DHA1 family tetracycline resistance protein-like MFS transporter